jgi:hypothetical protein
MLFLIENDQKIFKSCILDDVSLASLSIYSKLYNYWMKFHTADDNEYGTANFYDFIVMNTVYLMLVG